MKSAFWIFFFLSHPALPVKKKIASHSFTGSLIPDKNHSGSLVLDKDWLPYGLPENGPEGFSSFGCGGWVSGIEVHEGYPGASIHRSFRPTGGWQIGLDPMEPCFGGFSVFSTDGGRQFMPLTERWDGDEMSPVGCWRRCTVSSHQSSMQGGECR